MTTFAFLITILGAGTIAVNLMRLFLYLDRPQSGRRTRTA